MSSNITTRHTIESLFRLKLEMLRNMEAMEALSKLLGTQFQEVGAHSHMVVSNSFRVYAKNMNELAVDQAIWRYLVRLYHMEKFMLCTDWQKMCKSIEECQTPAFTIENAYGWLDGLKDQIQDNVKALVKEVYSRVVNGTYYTGGRYRGEKKKRNNQGIDSHFILCTSDYQSIFSYWQDGPTIMDDLEKVCYLLDGKTLPEKTLRQSMKEKRIAEAGNDYLTVKLCKNGNTHFTLTDSILDKLNRYGPDGAVIGENIKIKIFDKD